MSEKQIFILAKIEPQEKPIYLIIREGDYQHSEDVICEGDADPHGILQYIRYIPVPENFDKNGQLWEKWFLLFPELLQELENEQTPKKEAAQKESACHYPPMGSSNG